MTRIAVLSLTQLMLARYGYSVLTAASGREALHLFEVWPEQTVHFAILDIVTPEMDGFELAAALRVIRPDLPILFTSAYSDRPELRPERTRKIPYLAKPFTSVRLISKMREMLDGDGRELPTILNSAARALPSSPPDASIDMETVRAALDILRSHIDRTTPDPAVVAVLREKVGPEGTELGAQDLACTVIERYLQEAKSRNVGMRADEPDRRSDSLIQ
jgi:CheY-like chemotaxis protein